MKAVHARVSGRVQGVGYRQSCRQRARALSLDGWVRNLSDGGVEVVAQGPDDAIDELVTWLWMGPAGAQVSGVESDSIAVDRTLRDFFIYPNPTKGS